MHFKLSSVENPLRAKCLYNSCKEHHVASACYRNGCLMSIRACIASVHLEIINISLFQDSYACKLLRTGSLLWAKFHNSSFDFHCDVIACSKNGCLLSPWTWVFSFLIEIIKESQWQDSYSWTLFRVEDPLWPKCHYISWDSYCAEKACSQNAYLLCSRTWFPHCL